MLQGQEYFLYRLRKHFYLENNFPFRKNPDYFSCSDIQKCQDCTHPKGAKPGDKGNCWATPRYPVWKVTQYGTVSGVDHMKAEIFARGPISCGIDATLKLDASPAEESNIIEVTAR